VAVENEPAVRADSERNYINVCFDNNSECNKNNNSNRNKKAGDEIA